MTLKNDGEKKQLLPACNNISFVREKTFLHWSTTLYLIVTIKQKLVSILISSSHHLDSKECDSIEDCAFAHPMEYTRMHMLSRVTRDINEWTILIRYKGYSVYFNFASCLVKSSLMMIGEESNHYSSWTQFISFGLLNQIYVLQF